MYVDDGAIFGCGVSHIASAELVRTGFAEITCWLARNGLKSDPEKSEFISFAPKVSPDRIRGLVTDIHLSDTFADYGVRHSEVIRYLGIFIHHHFKWTHHVTIMANRVRSTVCALSILGNSCYNPPNFSLLSPPSVDPPSPSTQPVITITQSSPPEPPPVPVELPQAPQWTTIPRPPTPPIPWSQHTRQYSSMELYQEPQSEPAQELVDSDMVWEEIGRAHV